MKRGYLYTLLNPRKKSCDSFHRPQRRERSQALWIATAIIVIVVCLPVSEMPSSLALADRNLSVPADFSFALTVPGALNDIRRPGKVCFDDEAGEIYAVDEAHGRILIFDQDGTYKFEFSTAGYLGSVIDFAVSTDGMIYVLGSTSQDRPIFIFDFDGTYLGRVTPQDSSSDLDIISLALDADDQLYLLDRAGLQILAVTSDGRTVGATPLPLENMSKSQRSDLVLGNLTLDGGDFYVPLSSMGTVLRIPAGGDAIKYLGYAGSVPGAMAFPVAVAVTGDGMIMVLDKRRFNVLCFARDGAFLGEFGGKGISPGWFYYPSSIAVDHRDQVYISQVFQNRVQVCRIPEPIRQAFLQHGVETDFKPPLQSITPRRHPRSGDAAPDKETNAVQTNGNVTETTTQPGEV